MRRASLNQLEARKKQCSKEEKPKQKWDGWLIFCISMKNMFHSQNARVITSQVIN